jgi:hypothetical protein
MIGADLSRRLVMEAFYALLGVVLIALAFGLFVARVERLSFLAPGHTRGLGPSAAGFCSDRCRRSDGCCPLTDSLASAESCPLWKYVRADVPVEEHGSPFVYLREAPAGSR